MTTTGITLDQAQVVVDNARKKATEDGRMDGAWLGSIDVALDKAYTARAFDMPTRALAEPTQPGGAMYGFQTLTNDRGRIVVFAGRIPLEVDGNVVGAIGVGGGTPDQDDSVAQACVAGL